MTMRKFIIEFHPDGSVTWNEYNEPEQPEKDGYNSALRQVCYRLNSEHANYLTMASITEQDDRRRMYLECAGLCKRIGNIVLNMMK